MKPKRFAIPSLLAAGLFGRDLKATEHMQAQADVLTPDPQHESVLYDVVHDRGAYMVSEHRSHSSHRSHASHRSGAEPQPTYVPPAPSPRPFVPQSPPGRSEQSTPPSSGEERFTAIVRRVQSGLTAYGYYTGAIDGVVGPDTRSALTRFQTDYKLRITGTITPEVLSHFGIQTP
jgi:His-Xaa-Ser repeat protein HxsA